MSINYYGVNNMEWIVRADNLIKDFTDKKGKILAHALKSVDFTLKKGSLTAMVGPDGAGKTIKRFPLINIGKT